jgi:hypothetical protein
VYVSLSDSAEKVFRSATALPSANCGSAKYSIWATSGTPAPAATAFCSAVYWSLPVPAFTRLILTLGYLAWKAATTGLRVGSQAQTVRLPPASRAACTSAAETVPPVVLTGSPSPPSPHAVSERLTAAPTARILSRSRR